MKIKYFRDTDTLYIEFRETEVSETRDLDENTMIDLDQKGQICAITVEHAGECADIPHFSFEQIPAPALAKICVSTTIMWREKQPYPVIKVCQSYHPLCITVQKNNHKMSDTTKNKHKVTDTQFSVTTVIVSRTMNWHLMRMERDCEIHGEESIPIPFLPFLGRRARGGRGRSVCFFPAKHEKMLSPRQELSEAKASGEENKTQRPNSAGRVQERHQLYRKAGGLCHL